jgi:hypothetical protein
MLQIRLPGALQRSLISSPRLHHSILLLTSLYRCVAAVGLAGSVCLLVVWYWTPLGWPGEVLAALDAPGRVVLHLRHSQLASHLVKRGWRARDVVGGLRSGRDRLGRVAEGGVRLRTCWVVDSSLTRRYRVASTAIAHAGACSLLGTVLRRCVCALAVVCWRDGTAGDWSDERDQVGRGVLKNEGRLWSVRSYVDDAWAQKNGPQPPAEERVCIRKVRLAVAEQWQRQRLLLLFELQQAGAACRRQARPREGKGAVWDTVGNACDGGFRRTRHCGGQEDCGSNGFRQAQVFWWRGSQPAAAGDVMGACEACREAV